MISIDEELCKGCYICVESCPKKVFRISKGLNKKGIYPSAVGNIEDCNYCGICEIICPDQSIAVKK
ncbi:MAG: 2-oxoglutarate ferredoxin oxidoreductase subunit delta [Methanothermococcus sp.]|jgi:2-oxoglutarate ferredoxin oxidoreductase subunit delta|uniref:Pyruvate/2-ketoisovalerate oxidoreductase subunit delta n=1 Tax=Methanococcus maripaludis KA1 TaxID=637914 RepID=A0A2Z5PDI8_METMI|nr:MULTISPECIES: ferredoxin family protein [Methanococcaceae]MDK2790419.1 2-oxoglutarate ferredoxin oxidoreductase subunit delta [Methanothermococcus sp.]MDK2987948.1 2-oxoglutarate ferredoxin oxidoreductase subunit delta [Methanothermococcus sp.]BAP61222.1 pyruvate/2-ketoisovalerate oxidoreductase subunit delta [Methanococcus maripaludis KA1]